MLQVLVDPVISRQKLRKDFDLWQNNTPHRERGWVLLHYDEKELRVELAFLGRVSLNTGSAPLPVVVSAVRLTYENYDLWAPSLTFIDPFSRLPSKPHVRAVQSATSGPRDVLIDAHPETKLPFLCIPGIREYHSHPQHTGDEWLLHRSAGEGSIATICDRIWRYMARNVMGLTVHMQALPLWPLRAQLNITIAQGDLDNIDLKPAALPTQLERNELAPMPAS
jgi:putative metal binding uncharacterized protein